MRRGQSPAPRRRARHTRAAAVLAALALVLATGHPGARAVEGADIAPRSDHPLIDAAAPAAQGAEDPGTVRIAYPVIRAAGALEWRGQPFGLAGVAVTAPDATCGTEADAWPCGRVALTAIRRFVRTRTIECAAVDAAEPADHRARCTVGGRDIGEWLVTHGWAKAQGPAYGEAEQAAREAKAGLWSAVRPVMVGRAASASVSEADIREAAVLVDVDLSDQRLTLVHRGAVVASWPVSTARAGKVTPTGRYRAQWLSRHHRSSLYNNAPMPYSVFFNGDYAIHGTDQIGRLGRPASAGCIRLHPRHAAVVFDLARREGPSNTLVIVRR